MVVAIKIIAIEITQVVAIITIKSRKNIVIVGTVIIDKTTQISLN